MVFGVPLTLVRVVEAAQNEVNADPCVHPWSDEHKHNQETQVRGQPVRVRSGSCNLPRFDCNIHYKPTFILAPGSALTFLLPRDDLCLGLREEEVELQWYVGDQVLQDGRLLAAGEQRAAVGYDVYESTAPRFGTHAI